MKKKSLVAAIIVFGTVALLTTVGTHPCIAEELVTLQESDCIKCHSYEHAAIQSKGGKHATEVSCLACHPEHPPLGRETIAPCSRCHFGTQHLELKNCRQCHTKTHALQTSLQFPGNAQTACMTCHTELEQEFASSVSKHARLSCVSCHPTHNAIPDCLDCHEPHSAGQDMAICRLCHPAHSPRSIVPPSYASVSLCRPCHLDIVNNIRQTTTNHGTLRCTYCHQGRHSQKTILCRDCHGLPHDWKVHNQQKKCLACHRDPHLLFRS